MSEDDIVRPYIGHTVDDLWQLVQRYPGNAIVRNAVLRELTMRNEPAAEAVLLKLADSQLFENSSSDRNALGKPKYSYPRTKPTSSASGKFFENTNNNRQFTPDARPYGESGKPQGAKSKCSFSLTEEQKSAVEMFCDGESLRINAFAGTGKTTTLRAMADATRRRGLYLCFNRRLADEAATVFPSNVQCRTIHSLAYRYVRNIGGMSGKLEGSLTAAMIPQIVPIEPFSAQDFKYDSGEVRDLVWQTLRNFCYSADIDIEANHVPKTFSQRLLKKEECSNLRKVVTDRARSVWHQMIEPTVNTPLGHDGYLKYWALCRPKIDSDFVLLDEAQDTNPVVLGVLAQQETQIAFVGDRYQQIYQWRGAINAMEAELAKKTTYLTKSFRFGSSIASHANRILRKLGEKRSLEGCGPSAGASSNVLSRAILARTNARLLEELVSQIRLGERPWLEGGTTEIRDYLNGLSDLKKDRPTRHPEFFGIRNWRELIDFSNTEHGRSIQGLLHLVTRMGFQPIFQAIDFVDGNAANPTITLSTLHKAKGREWDRVELLDDFRTPDALAIEKNSAEAKEELRINYVAITRAKHTIALPDNIGVWLYQQ